MQNLNFDDGFKEFSINGDKERVIRFNPSDFGILERIEKANKAINEATKGNEDLDLKADGTAAEELSRSVNIVKGISDTIKNQIDYIFDSPVSSIVFGNQSPLSMVKGVPFFERFLDAVTPVIKKEITAEQGASQKRMQKYTKAVK